MRPRATRTSLVTAFAAALALVLGVATPAAAQGPPRPGGGGPGRGPGKAGPGGGGKPGGPPVVDQIKKLVEQAIERLVAQAQRQAESAAGAVRPGGSGPPSGGGSSDGSDDGDGASTSETELVKIVHAPIPSDPKKLLGHVSDLVPSGLDVDAAIEEHRDEILKTVNAGVSRIAFIALEDLTFRSKRIPKGAYLLALRFKNDQLSNAVLTGDSLKSPISIELAGGRLKTPAAVLSVRTVVDEREKKRGIRSVRLVAEFGKTGGEAKQTFRGSGSSSGSNENGRSGPPGPGPGPRPPGPR